MYIHKHIHIYNGYIPRHSSMSPMGECCFCWAALFELTNLLDAISGNTLPNPLSSSVHVIQVQTFDC